MRDGWGCFDALRETESLIDRAWLASSVFPIPTLGTVEYIVHQLLKF